MTNLSLLLVLQISTLAAGPETYEEAHKKVVETGQPLVVMVGADWCPACQVMKSTIIPQIRHSGLLGKVAFATVNLDERQELGRTLVAGGPIPQLLMYRQTAAGWRLRRLIGRQSVASVEAFINGGIELEERPHQSEARPQNQTSGTSAEVKSAKPAVAGPMAAQVW